MNKDVGKEMKADCFHENRPDIHKMCKFVSSSKPELDYLVSNTLEPCKAFILLLNK